MKNNLKEEVKLMNLIRLLEIYGDGKFGVTRLITEKDKAYIKSKVLEHTNIDFLSESLRNDSRLRLIKLENKENWIRYSEQEKELLKKEILRGLFNPEFDTTEDDLTKEIAVGNMIEAMSLQSKNGFMGFTEEQTNYLNTQISSFKEETNKRINTK